MFEVVITYNNGWRETYDCMTELQATFIFFRARMDSNVDMVELNEMVEVEFFA